MKFRAGNSLKLIFVAIVCGCEPVSAPPAPLDDNQLQDTPPIEEPDTEHVPIEASVPRAKSDGSVPFGRDAGLDASSTNAPDSSMQPATDATTGSRMDSSSVSSDASMQYVDSALGDAAPAMQEAGSAGTIRPPNVLTPPRTGNAAIDGHVDAIVRRCQSLSPDKVYMRAAIQPLAQSAIYDPTALREPCQATTFSRPVITGMGVMLVVSPKSTPAYAASVATAAIRAPKGDLVGTDVSWGYGWIDDNNNGDQGRLDFSLLSCSAPRIYAIPDSTYFYLFCSGTVTDDSGRTFSLSGADILAIGRDGLILAYVRSTLTQPAHLAYYMRDMQLATFPLDPNVYVSAARSSGAGFLLAIGGVIFDDPTYPDHLYYMGPDGTREDRGTFPRYGAQFASYLPVGGNSGRRDAALDATGVLYDMRSRFFSTNGDERGIVIRRTVGASAAEVVYEDPSAEGQDLDPFRLSGLVTGP